MSKRDEGLLLDALATRWGARGVGTAGATASASVNAQFPTNQLLSNKFKHNVTAFSYSINNGLGAASSTVTAKISSDSIGGTVLADWDFIVAAGSAVQGTFANLDLPGLKGSDVVASISAAGSVVPKVSVSGWTDTMVNG